MDMRKLVRARDLTQYLRLRGSDLVLCSTADHFLFSLILQNAFLVKWKDMTDLLTSKRSKVLIFTLQDYCMFPPRLQCILQGRIRH